jgi:hypothetical protein
VRFIRPGADYLYLPDADSAVRRAVATLEQDSSDMAVYSLLRRTAGD